MDEEVSIFSYLLDIYIANQTEQTAAVFLEGGVNLRQFSPVHLTSRTQLLKLLTRYQPRKGLVHLI